MNSWKSGLGPRKLASIIRLQVMSDTQDKTDAYAALDAEDVENYLEDILNEEITCDCQE
jgi:hypothetical protein